MSDFLRKYILRDLYQPHPWWGFDGPYTRLQMDDGSSFIFIMSSVWKATTNPYLCHASYAPLPSMKADAANEIDGFAKDWYPNAMGITRRKQGDEDGVASFGQTAFVPEEDSVFKLDVTARKQAYHHRFPHPVTGKPLQVEVDIRDNTPHSLCGPMWLARFMPIPLKWHIFSTRSRATVTISDENKKVLLKKVGLAHQEKNWGIGFPSAWIWCQGFCTPAERGSLAIAGGQVTFFLRAFMLAYRSPTSHRNWDFGPASTVQLFGWGPFCKMTRCESEKGEIELICTNWLNGWRIKVLGSGRPDTFQMMSAPLPRGHTEWYCHETFQATYKVTLYEKPWFRAWREVEHTTIENSALEFGGDWSHWWRQYDGPEKKDA